MADQDITSIVRSEINDILDRAFDDRFRERFDETFDKKLKHYRTAMKFFLLGLGLFVVLVIGAGLLGKADILRTLHDSAFPPEGPNTVTISYEGSLELLPHDPRSQSRAISFYVEEGHRTEVYARLVHRFRGDAQQRRVIITIDGQQYGEPTEQLEGGFHDITGSLNWDTRFKTTKNVHRIVFELDDSQPDTLRDEVTVVCVVLVYGKG